MIEFEEPSSEYHLEKIKKRSVATKVRVATLFIVYILSITFIVKNDFNFDFNSIKAQASFIESVCQNDLEYSNREDEESRVEKGRKVIDQNQRVFQEMKGFHKSYITLEPVGYQGKRIPVIRLEFKGTVELDKKIPEKICGFKVSVIYK